MGVSRVSPKAVSLVIGSGLLALAGLNWNIGIAVWLAPVFLLYYAKNSLWPGFLLLFLCISLATALSKTGENVAGIFIATLISGVSWGVIYSLPFLIERFLNTDERRFYSTLIFPAAFVFIEYLYSLKFGMWGQLVLAQYSYLNLTQILSVFGIFGLSFLSLWFASLVNWLIDMPLNQPGFRRGLIIYGTVFMAVMLFGQLRLEFFSPQSDTVKTAAIIGKTDLFQIAEKYEETIIELSENYVLPIPDSLFSEEVTINWQLEKTLEAAGQDAKIIVWSEISLILKQNQLKRVLEGVRQICTKEKVYVLLAFLEKDDSDLPKPFNNKSVLVTPDGNIGWEYIKNFGHPMEDLIFNKGDYSLPYLDTEYGRIGNVICADMDLPKYISQAGKKSIDIMLVPALDWEEIASYHPRMAAFSAIQFGFSLLRANGKGLVTFHDFQGNVIAKQSTSTSINPIIYAELPIKSTMTAYSIIGDVFVYLLILFLVLATGIRIAKNRYEL